MVICDSDTALCEIDCYHILGLLVEWNKSFFSVACHLEGEVDPWRCRSLFLETPAWWLDLPFYGQKLVCRVFWLNLEEFRDRAGMTLILAALS